MSFAKLRKIFKRDKDDEIPFDFVAAKMEKLNREMGIIS